MKKYKENRYIFKWANGEPYAPDYISKHFARILENARLPHIRFHDLRHSCASLLINADVSLNDVKAWMGHADIRMTADLYGHLDVARKQMTASQMESTLFKC